MLQTLHEQIASAFPGQILNRAIKNTNELHLEINPFKTQEICGMINSRLEGTLAVLFANDERALTGYFALYYVFALRKSSVFIILKAAADQNGSFPSITTVIPAAQLYEREIKDLFGLVPLGHPDQRSLVFHGNWPDGCYPLRKDYNLNHKPPMVEKVQEFVCVEGEGVYEIPVGPVHAGIIEPGHFRFSVAGEPIINLEAQLYYVHKGIEKLAEGMSLEKGLFLSERISGDESFANSLAYCQAVEKLAGIKIPSRARYIRVVFAEMERLISHLGDLAGICVDVAYGFAAFQFRLLRGWSYQMAEEVGMSRFLRSINKPGGVRRDFIAGNEEKIREYLRRISGELSDTVRIIKGNNLFIDRVENTGVLSSKTARDLNAVGPGGRAAGINTDMRREFPYAVYHNLNFCIPEHNNGDVNCRMNVKIEECAESIKIILQALESMPRGEINTLVGHVGPYRSALGYCESPRGENIHWIMTGENDTIFRYKIRTPSFCNWPILCHAVKGNIVPDFPLINKSFNLSYAGNDL